MRFMDFATLLRLVPLFIIHHRSHLSIKLPILYPKFLNYLNETLSN